MTLSSISLASNIVGMPVRNRSGETLGRVEDLIIDQPAGTVNLAVLSLSAFPGFHDRLFAVPIGVLESTAGRDFVLLDVDKNLLEEAPSFERGRWPDVSDRGWRTHIYNYYGQEEPFVPPDRTVVVHREYYPRRRQHMPVVASVLLVIVMIAAMSLGYMISTRGWDQTRNEIMSSFTGVAYAMKETSADAALTAKVKTALSLNRNVAANEVNVDSRGGIVTLRGEVGSAEARETAGAIAQDTPGVQEVRNLLLVLPAGSK